MLFRSLKFYSDSCGPCKVLTKNLKEAGIDVENINVQEDSYLIDKYEIKNIPTLIKIENDTILDRFTGIMTVDQLKNWCK